MKTTRTAGAILLAGGLCLACSGHGSPTEAAGPKIANLSNPARATLLPGGPLAGQRPGVLPITFSFTDPNGDVDEVFVNLPNGSVHNPLQGLQGLTAGTAGLEQDLLLPAPGTKVTYTLLVTDARGNPSNTLSGTFIAP